MTDRDALVARLRQWADALEYEADPYPSSRAELLRKSADALARETAGTPCDQFEPFDHADEQRPSACVTYGYHRADHAEPRDVPGWNVLTLETIDRIVRTTCSRFRGSDHGNATAKTTGESSRCLNCNDPQWKHWLEAARVVMTEWQRETRWQRAAAIPRHGEG